MPSTINLAHLSTIYGTDSAPLDDPNKVVAYRLRNLFTRRIMSTWAVNFRGEFMGLIEDISTRFVNNQYMVTLNTASKYITKDNRHRWDSLMEVLKISVRRDRKDGGGFHQTIALTVDFVAPVSSSNTP